MKIRFLLIAMAVIGIPINVSSVQPVLATNFVVDTSLYERDIPYIEIIPGPFSSNQAGNRNHGNTMFVFAYRRKNSKQYDIYSFEGICGTTIIPILNDSTFSTSILLSRNMIDGDDGWEAVVNYNDALDYSRSNFKVFDENGNELLAEAGIAVYGFDGNSTYVVVMTGGLPLGIKSWRFRTNILAQNPKSLAKTTSIQQAQMQIYGLSGGNYKVSFSPSLGNQVQFQMFDLMGRCVFSKHLENLKSPVSFTIPESNVPNSPFIAKVKDGNETLYKKQIPVK